ncbi:hypothetical protein PTW37_06615 [Arthrobacter agilis]|uniref:hypothetical protein n=1 Tax=Arthrobacter agilis TaxID=37921 RepID=UPI002365BE01|nr:hypothetical protein [Arthrobacter agilis]WDF34567.1 hypothetical protein PTW37_06615 [Arthrobacter agilis]
MRANIAFTRKKDPRAACQQNARVLKSTKPYEEIEMPSTETIAPTTVVPSTAPEGFTREYPGSQIFLGGSQSYVDIFDGVQIMWHETNGFALTVTVDDDLDAKDALKLAEAIRVGTARMIALKAAHEGRSIWKKDKSGMFEGLWDGPRSSLTDLESTLQARYTEKDGVTMWFDIERRPTEQYTVAEIRKLHRAMGRVLDKVEAEPKPAVGGAA